jgi:hypothetical protein
VKAGGPVQGPQTARMMARPQVRTAAERANDQSLEYAILGARVWAVLAALVLVGAVVGCVWTLDWRWAATAVLAGVNAGLAGWWGWWLKGNEDWRS